MKRIEGESILNSSVWWTVGVDSSYSRVDSGTVESTRGLSSRPGRRKAEKPCFCLDCQSQLELQSSRLEASSSRLEPQSSRLEIVPVILEVVQTCPSRLELKPSRLELAEIIRMSFLLVFCWRFDGYDHLKVLRLYIGLMRALGYSDWPYI